MEKTPSIMKGMSAAEKKNLRGMLEKIRRGDSGGMLLERLKQRNDIFRVREGNLRLLYRQGEDENISLLAMERIGEPV